jgi:hypothetical protein
MAKTPEIATEAVAEMLKRQPLGKVVEWAKEKAQQSRFGDQIAAIEKQLAEEPHPPVATHLKQALQALKEAEASGLAPTLETVALGVLVVAHELGLPLMLRPATAGTAARKGQGSVKRHHMTEAEQKELGAKILASLPKDKEKAIRLAEIAKAVGIEQSPVRKLVSDGIKAGTIVKIGGRKDAKYAAK